MKPKKCIKCGKPAEYVVGDVENDKYVEMKHFCWQHFAIYIHDRDLDIMTG